MEREEWLAIKDVIKGIREEELAKGSRTLADRMLMVSVGIEPVFSLTHSREVGEEISQQYRDAYLLGAINLLMAMKEAIGLEEDGWHDSIDDCWIGDIALRKRSVEEVGKDIGKCIRENYIYPLRAMEAELDDAPRFCDRDDCEHRIMDMDDEEEDKESVITVGVKKPGKPIEFKKVKNELKTWKELVGGYIQVVPTDLPDVLAIVNEEGKIEGLEPNIDVGYDVLVGTVVFVGDGGENFVGLCEEDMNELEEEYDD